MEIYAGFSIREYALRMRSVDVVKCWPFEEATDEESVKSLLPPITVKKFTWWVDELNCLGSESSKIYQSSRKKGNKMKNKVPKRGEPSSRNEDVAKDSDSEAIGPIMPGSLNAKTRVPKKRSILEIFAVAPPVDRVSSEVEDDSFQEDDGLSDNSKVSVHEEVNWGFKGKRNEKKKEKKKTRKNKEVISSNLKRATKVINKIKNTMSRKEDDKMHPSVQESEETGLMHKLQGQYGAVRSSDSPRMMMMEGENGINSPVSIHKKNMRRQHHHGAAKNSMARKDYKVSVQNQHQSGISKPGILKNHRKASSELHPTRHMLQEAFRVNDDGEQKADKHVTFLERDNLLRPGRRPSRREDCFKLQACSASDMQNAHHLASGVGLNSTIVETSESEDICDKIEDEWDGKLASKKQSRTSFHPVDTSISKNQCNREGQLSRSVDDNRQSVFDVGICEISCNPNYYNTQNMKVMANSLRSTGKKLIKDLGSPVRRSPSASKSYTEHAVSAVGREIPQASSRRTALDVANLIEDNTIPHLSPTVLQRAVRFPADAYQAESICGKGSIPSVNEHIIGLPLNSKGEFFTVSSNARGSLNEMKNQNPITSPSIGLSLPSNTLSKCLSQQRLDCRISSSDNLSLFPFEGHSKEIKSAVFAPSRLNMDVCRGNGKVNLNMDLTKIIDHSFHRENLCCKEENNFPKAYENEKILSTMRWMGKEFVVGGRGFHEFADGHTWKDKQTMDELHYSNTLIRHHQSEPSSGKLRETLFCPSEISASHSSRSMPIFQNFDCETSSTHQTGTGSWKIGAVEQGLSPSAFSDVYKGEYSKSKPIQSGYASQLRKFELPVPPSACNPFDPDARSGDIRLMKKQNLPLSSRSAFRFPFMHPDLDRRLEPYCPPNPHMNQTPFYFDCPEDETSMSNNQHHHFSGSHHANCLIPGTNHWTGSSVPPNLRTSHANDPFTFGSTMRSPKGISPSPILLTQQTAGRTCPRLLPISSVRKRQGIQKIRERIKSRIAIRDSSHGRQAKNNPLAVSNASFKTVRTPQCVITKSATGVNFEDLQRVETAPVSCPTTSRSKVVLLDTCGGVGNEHQTNPWIDSYSNIDKSGPVKLAAGAKHILKACQQVNHSHSRATCSNVPLAATSAGFMFSESDNPAMVYKF